MAGISLRFQVCGYMKLVGGELHLACENSHFFCSLLLLTFCNKEPLGLSNRNSILMMKINVYIINPVVLGFQMQICSILHFSWSILVLKVLCSSANELQQNSKASSIEKNVLYLLTSLCLKLSQWTMAYNSLAGTHSTYNDT